MSIRCMHFGTLSSGEEVSLFILEAGCYKAFWMDYGATWLGMIVPDSRGNPADVLLGHSTLSGYASDRAHFGSTIGRFANRIAKGRFSLDGNDIRLSVNNGPNHLHGGIGGLSQKLWNCEILGTGDSGCLRFSRTSPDGEEGYPGTLDISVTISLSEAGRLRLEYSALSDSATPVNLTNHAYFNLAGQGSGRVYDHELRIAASHYLEVDEHLIPLPGSPRPVEGTIYDFRTAASLGSRIAGTPNQSGFDHCLVLDATAREKEAALLSHPESGRKLAVRTSMPSLQLYTANHFVDKIGKSGRTYVRHSGVCLETEYFPDSPNRPDFPDCMARPGIPWKSWTEYEFMC